MLQTKQWLEYKWNKKFTVLVEKNITNHEEITEFWLRKKDYGVIDFMFGIPGHLDNIEIETLIENNIYDYIAAYEVTNN